MFQLCHVMDTVELVTGEGKYFTAYKPIKGGRRGRYTKHRSLLHQGGITETTLKSDCRRLTAMEAATLCKLVRVNPKACGITPKASHGR
jgi:hypothetical protein